MTLGATPSWRACPPPLLLQQLLRPPRSPPLARLLRLPRPSHRCFSRRAQSTAASDPVPPALPSPAHHDRPVPPLPELAAPEPSPLIDRLRPVPVRRHGAGESAVVAPLDVYPNTLESRNARVSKHRALTQQVRAAQHWERTQPWSERIGDWRVVLRTLMASSPAREEHREGVKIIIPPHSVPLLLSDFQNNLWNIKSRSKCDLTLCQPVEDVAGVAEDAARGPREAADAQPYILISGQPADIGEAADDILELAGRASLVNTAISPEMAPPLQQPRLLPTRGPAAPPFTATAISHYPMSAPCKPYKLTTRADEIPQPRIWTMETFQLYIAALVMGRPHGGYAERKYVGNTNTHQDAVVRLLGDVFNDPAASRAITIPALKLALSYLVRSGETFFPRARALVDRALRLGLRLDTEVFNMLAETAVKTRNLLVFQHNINKMVAHGHKADLRTWTLFLSIIQAEEVKRYIIHSMDAKNYFVDPRAVNSVATQMADHDIYRAIQLGQDVDVFLAELRELYGPEWRLHTRAANRYLEILGRYGKFDDCKRLLEHMFEAGQRKPDTVSLNTILSHCKTHRKADLAVDMVRSFDKHDLRVADKVTIHLLVELARELRKPHLLGAVWRYAHLVKLTDRRTERRGLELLQNDSDRERHILRLLNRLRSLWEPPNDCGLTKAQFVANLLLCDRIQALGNHGVGLAEGGAAEENDSRPQKKMRSPQLPPEPQPSVRFSPQDYYQYSRWVCDRAERYEPAIPLGEFLYAALARDRRLHKLAHTETSPKPRQLRVELDPVKLPIRRRQREKQTEVQNEQ